MRNKFKEEKSKNELLEDAQIRFEAEFHFIFLDRVFISVKERLELMEERLFGFLYDIC